MRVRLHEPDGCIGSIRPLLEALGFEVAEQRETLPLDGETAPAGSLRPHFVLWSLSNEPETTAREVRYLLSDPELEKIPFLVSLPPERAGLEMAINKSYCAAVVRFPASLHELSSSIAALGRPFATFIESRARDPRVVLLAVEDSKSALAAEVLLEGEDHLVLRAENPDEAHLIAKRISVDLLLHGGSAYSSLSSSFSEWQQDAAIISADTLGFRGESMAVGGGEEFRPVVGGESLRDAVDVALKKRSDFLRRRKLEGEIASKQRALQRMNTTLRTVNKAIREANVRLERQGYIKNEMMGVAAHELKTPLAAMAGALEFLRRDEGRFDQADADLIQLLDRNTDRMIKLVNDILDLSRVEAGRLSVKKELLDPGPLIEQAINTVAIRAKAKGVRFQVLISEESNDFEVDGGRLVQMLINLLDNAVKFSPADDIVQINVLRLKEKMHFVVSDRGPGIPDENREVIFESFHHRAKDSDPSSAGSGLGLTISKALAELHGGSISVGDSPEGGAKFTLTLPVSRS